MKRYVLTLILMAAFSTAINAQEEVTAAPSFIMGWNSDIRQVYSDPDYSGFMLSECQYVQRIENTDEADATIYYRLDNLSGTSEWIEYIEEEYNPFHLWAHYAQVEAYAIADGKLPSEVVSTNVFYNVYIAYEACLVDGISYRFNSGGDYPYMDDMVTEVFVTSYEDSHLYTPPYYGNLVIPSEIIFRDKTFTVTEIYYKAFASTFSRPCEITSVELPSTITNIWQTAFAGCVNLNRMIVHAVTPPYAVDIFYYDYGDEDYNYYDYLGFNVDALYDQVTLFVPYESIEEYRATWEWGKFTHIVPFIGAGPGDINGDGNIAINDVTGLIDQLLDGEEIPAYCDVDGDGKVSIKDVTALIDQLLSGN